MSPQNAIYVWYPKRLCKELDREDIKVVSPHQVELAIIGLPRMVVLDHATDLSERTMGLIRNHNKLVRRPT
jgi:hypothetical protein